MSQLKPNAVYQIGVDVLGFPIYAEHYLFIVNAGQSHQCNKVKPRRILKSVQRIVKQH